MKVSEGLRESLRQYERLIGRAFSNETSVSYPPLGDALGNPTGATRIDYNHTAEVFKADFAWGSSMGSTTFNHVIMTYFRRACFKKTVLLAANTHMSIVNAAADLDIPIKFIPVGFDPYFEIVIPPSFSSVEKIIREENEKPAGLFMVSPTYEGLHANIRELSRLRDTYAPGCLLVVDNAWGWGLETPLDDGADIVVRSTHKMDGGKQGSSVILAKYGRIDADILGQSVTARLSTSQSYPILGSIPWIYDIWAEYGEELTMLLCEWSDCFKKYLVENGVEVLDERYLKPLMDSGVVKALDPRKITFRIEGMTGKQLGDECFKRGVVLEKMGLKTATVIVTIKAIEKLDAEKTAKVIVESMEDSKSTFNPPILEPPLSQWDRLGVMQPYEAVAMGKEMAPLGESVNRIAAETITPYPPGIPWIIPGQIVRREDIEFLKMLHSLGYEVVATDPLLERIMVVK